MLSYLLLIAVVYAVALLPIFGPPVWIVLVVAKVRWDLNPVLLVGLGAISATAGRLTLARVSRHLTRWVPRRAKENLEAAHDFLDSHEMGILALLAVFIVSPLPSGQLWVAAGLLKMRLLPLGVAFFIGRTISYSGYVTAATVAQYELGDILARSWGKPWMIAVQVVLALLIVALPLMPWKKRSDRSVS